MSARILDYMRRYDYKKLVFCNDASSGLRAIIAIHSTSLGPATGGRKKKKQLFLEVVEPPDQAGRAFNLQDELTVGRSPGCGVPTTYDAYSSTLHARLYRRGDQLMVEDLGSTNGTYVNSERIAKPTKLARGDLLQIGATVFEVTR